MNQAKEGEESKNQEIMRQAKLPKYKEIYYRVMIVLTDFYCRGIGGSTTAFIPVAIIYFATAYLISVLINYDPFMMPPILNVFILGVCLLLWFYIGHLVEKKGKELQRKFESKLKSTN